MARLDVFEERCEFIVAWDDEGYPGLVLGQKCDADAEHSAATVGAASLGIHRYRFDGSLTWEVKSDATKALRVARAAVKVAKDSKPMPAWALTAISEGWKPPKGWRP